VPASPDRVPYRWASETCLPDICDRQTSLRHQRTAARPSWRHGRTPPAKLTTLQRIVINGRALLCSVALGVKKRVLRAPLRRRASSVLPRERTAPIVCDVDVERDVGDTVTSEARIQQRRSLHALPLGTNRTPRAKLPTLQRDGRDRRDRRERSKRRRRRRPRFPVASHLACDVHVSASTCDVRLTRVGQRLALRSLCFHARRLCASDVGASHS